MQSKEKDYSLTMAAAVVAFIGMVVVVAAVFFISALTVICIFAWNRPVRVRGQTIEPGEARGFIFSGLLGGLVIGLLSAYRPEGFDLNYALWGYVCGAFAFLAYSQFMGEIEEVSGDDTFPPPQPLPGQHEQPAPRPFTFASWDDEEMR